MGLCVTYNGGAAQIEIPKLRAAKTDPYLRNAAERVKVAAQELERAGIADKAGKRLRKHLPKDMREGIERDLGG
jgi:hypothetical protein